MRTPSDGGRGAEGEGGASLEEGQRERQWSVRLQLIHITKLQSLLHSPLCRPILLCLGLASVSRISLPVFLPFLQSGLSSCLSFLFVLRLHNFIPFPEFVCPPFGSHICLFAFLSVLLSIYLSSSMSLLLGLVALHLPVLLSSDHHAACLHPPICLSTCPLPFPSFLLSLAPFLDKLKFPHFFSCWRHNGLFSGLKSAARRGAKS